MVGLEYLLWRLACGSMPGNGDVVWVRACSQNTHNYLVRIRLRFGILVDVGVVNVEKESSGSGSHTVEEIYRRRLRLRGDTGAGGDFIFALKSIQFDSSIVLLTANLAPLIL